MAKAKKQETAGEPAAAAAAEAGETKKRAPRKAPAAKAKAAEAPAAEAKATAAAPAAAPPAAKVPAKQAVPAAPMIDTSLAARAAASFVVNRNLLGDADKSSAPKGESAAFKQLKQGANKTSANLGALFGTSGDEKKSGKQFGAGGSSYRAQTQAGFNKTGVPRRTSG